LQLSFQSHINFLFFAFLQFFLVHLEGNCKKLKKNFSFFDFR